MENQHTGAPFSWYPKDGSRPETGALLIHGLLDSSFIMRDVGKILLDQGIAVEGILLPGHGTTPDDLLTVQHDQWQEAVTNSIRALQSRVRKIILTGYSLGGALAALHALDNSAIAGIILLCPAFRIAQPTPAITALYSQLRRIFPLSGWIKRSTELDSVKYCSISLKAVQQVYELTQILQQKLLSRPLACPLLLAASLEDGIICSKTAIGEFGRNTHPSSSAIVWAASPENACKKCTDKRIVWRTSQFPQMGITEFSHIAPPVAPDNPHYGSHGDYQLASHIDPLKWRYGEETELCTIRENLKYLFGLSRQKYRRLTFNPDFSYMKQKIIQFVNMLG